MSDRLRKELLAFLHQEYGPLIASKDLWKVLGFPTTTAYRQARSRYQGPIVEFSIKGRRGRFSLTLDVVNWLVAQRNGENEPNK